MAKFNKNYKKVSPNKWVKKSFLDRHPELKILLSVIASLFVLIVLIAIVN